MESLPAVIDKIEDEIAKLEKILEGASEDISAKAASEQAGLKKLLTFAREISSIQARFESKFK